jgi:hypothetical protein
MLLLRASNWVRDLERTCNQSKIAVNTSREMFTLLGMQERDRFFLIRDFTGFSKFPRYYIPDIEKDVDEMG